jgi:hypothetical protein
LFDNGTAGRDVLFCGLLWLLVFIANNVSDFVAVRASLP